MLTVVKPTMDRKGQSMAFATLEDFTGNVEMLIFSDPYAKYQEHLKPESAVLVSGRTSAREEEEPKIIVSRIVPLSEAIGQIPATVHLRVHENLLGDAFLEDLGRLAKEYPGNSRIRFHLVAEDESEVEMGTRESGFSPQKELVRALTELAGDGNAWVERCSIEDWG
jgi:DNA polymerase-3 subunit alpha